MPSLNESNARKVTPSSKNSNNYSNPSEISLIESQRLAPSTKLAQASPHIRHETVMKKELRYAEESSPKAKPELKNAKI